MNKDQIKGGAKEIAGKVQRAAGELVDSPSQEAKGAVKEQAGKVQKNVGTAKEVVKDNMRKP